MVNITFLITLFQQTIQYTQTPINKKNEKDTNTFSYTAVAGHIFASSTVMKDGFGMRPINVWLTN